MLSRSARMCSRSGTPARRFVTERPSCVYAGNVMTISASVVHSAGDPGRTVHAATSSTTSDGGIRLRRRLSRIFQREIAGSRLAHDAPLVSRHRGQSQRTICQSPRTQRCWRAAKLR